MPAYTLRQLECFVTIAEEGSIQAAASRLYASASALSSALNTLETALDTQLAIRQKAHGVTLTPAGNFILRRARNLLQDAEELAPRQAGDGAALQGSVTVGCYSTLAPSLLSELIDVYTRRYPQVAVDFVHGPQPMLLDELRSGHADFALAYDMQLGPELEHQPLFNAHASVIFAPEHPLAQQPEPTLAELAAHPMIMLDMAPSRENTMRMFTSHGLSPNIRFRTSDYEVTRSMVARNLGWAPLVQEPNHSCSFEGRPLVVRPLAEDDTGVPVAVTWIRASRLSQPATAMVELSQELFGQWPTAMTSTRSSST